MNTFDDKISSNRTKLRRFQISDLQNMISLESDPEVMKYTPMRKPQALEKTEARLKDLISKELDYAPLGVWAVGNRLNLKFFTFLPKI